MLTHWGRVTHWCFVSLTIIASYNGLSPGQRQAIKWTNAGILLIGPLGTTFSEISIKFIHFHPRKCISKYRLENDGHFVSASMCWILATVASSRVSDDRYKTDSRLAPSQWETSLQPNEVSHWLGTNLESALQVSDTPHNHCHRCHLAITCHIPYCHQSRVITSIRNFPGAIGRTGRLISCVCQNSR